MRKFETWFDEVNAPTQALMDVEAQDAQDAQGSGGDDDEEVFSVEGENEALEQKKIDDEVVELTLQGTVTLV